MTYLLDVNALVALGFDGHEHHERVGHWLKGLPVAVRLATCPITELGFVRVLQQAPQYRVAIADGRNLLARLQGNGVRPVVFLADGHGAANLPSWVKTGRQTTDGHLLALAGAHGARLATLDKGIPGAFMIPVL